MHKNDRQIAVRDQLVLLLVLINVVAVQHGFATNPMWYRVSFIALPLLVFVIIGIDKRISKL